MTKVMHPSDLNATFATLYNAGDLTGLLALYEPQAAHQNAQTLETDVGLPAIERSLRALLKIPGKMTSQNNFCIIASDVALLRADWSIKDARGETIAAGSSAEIARRQQDGSWLSVIDHAVGASLPRVMN